MKLREKLKRIAARISQAHLELAGSNVEEVEDPLPSTEVDPELGSELSDRLEGLAGEFEQLGAKDRAEAKQIDNDSLEASGEAWEEAAQAVRCLLHNGSPVAAPRRRNEYPAAFPTEITPEYLASAPPDQCPTCGSGDRFVLKEECALDSHDPDPWHRGLPAPPEDSGEETIAYWKERAGHAEDALLSIAAHLAKAGPDQVLDQDKPAEEGRRWVVSDEVGMKIIAAYTLALDALKRYGLCPPSPPEPQAQEGEKHPAEISWCHIHRVARESSGCARCLEQTGGYTTHVYVPAGSATRIAELEAAVREAEADCLSPYCKDPSCRCPAGGCDHPKLTWQEVAEREGQAALDRRGEGRADYLRAERAEAVLEEAAAKLERRAMQAKTAKHAEAHLEDAQLLRKEQAALKGGRG